MTATIQECQQDQEFRGVIPVHSWDELADLQASVERFGYLAPFIVWRNEAGVPLLLDGHARLAILREALKLAHKARAKDPKCPVSRAAIAPDVVTIELASRDDAVLWIVNNQLGRRNLSAIDRIALVAKREEIRKRMAKANQKTSTGGVSPQLLARAPEAAKPIDVRKESAAEARVGEHTYDAGKQVLAAVAEGKLPQETIADINAGKLSIRGAAKGIKGKPASKPKSSGWQTLVRGFTAAVRRVIKRDPARSAEIAVELRRLADEFEVVAKAAA